MSQSMQAIGIIGAMQVEVDHLIADLRDCVRSDHAHTTFYQGILGKKPVVVVRSGVGKVNAAACAQLLIDHFQPASIINTGIAGAVASNLGIGDVVIANDCCEHDVDVTNLSYPKGQIPDMDVFAFQADTQLVRTCLASARASQAFPQVHEGRIVSGDQFVHTRAKKEELWRDYHALCCEMEGAAIAHVCYLNELPFAIVRTISDAADEVSSLDYPSFEKKAADANARLIELVLSSM